MNVRDAVDDIVCRGFYAPVISGTSALSFEPLCKLNDGWVIKDFDWQKIAEQFRMIAEQFRTKLFSENFALRSYCYKGTYLFNEEYACRDYSTVLFYIIGKDRRRLYTRFSLIGVSFIDFIQIRENIW